MIDADLTDYAMAIDVFTCWHDYYNNRRPHSALHYLRPVDYYRADPEARLAERQQKLLRALAARQMYWKGKEPEVQTEAAGG